MHRWVVMRVERQICKWDITRDPKMGASESWRGVTLKPGVRVLGAHSKCWMAPAWGLRDFRRLGEQMWLKADGTWRDADPKISLLGNRALIGAAQAV